MALKAPEMDKRTVPEVPWDTFQHQLAANWEQGQHVSAIGKNGSGKTTMLVQICDSRRYVVVLLTKRTDPLFPLLQARGYTSVEGAKDWLDKDWAPKVSCHIPPKALTRAETTKQADAIRRVLHRVWDNGNWTLYIDEIAELSDLLRMDTELRTMWKEARSSNVSLVAGTQRPARVPIEMYDQPRFLFFWKNNNREGLKRIADMNAIDPESVRQIIPQLDDYEVLVVDSNTDTMVRTRPPKLSGRAK